MSMDETAETISMLTEIVKKQSDIIDSLFFTLCRYANDDVKDLPVVTNIRDVALLAERALK